MADKKVSFYLGVKDEATAKLKQVSKAAEELKARLDALSARGSLLGTGHGLQNAVVSRLEREAAAMRAAVLQGAKAWGAETWGGHGSLRSVTGVGSLNALMNSGGYRGTGELARQLVEPVKALEQTSRAADALRDHFASLSKTMDAAALQSRLLGDGMRRSALGAVTGAGSLSSLSRGSLRGTVADSIATHRESLLAKSMLAAEALSDPARKVESFSSILSSNKLAIAAWGAAVFAAGKQALDAAVMVDRLNKAYTTIEGSAVGARLQLDYMYETSNRLGLQFYQTAEASKNFFASMKGTAIEGEANKIWESVATAATALSLSETDVERVFRALGQMVSKGKVQAEEIRGQLSEVLPGAFQLAAKALKVTTAELDKMLERGQVLSEELLPKMAVEIQKTYGEASIQAANGLQQSLYRVSTEWERFKSSILNSEVVAQNLRRIASAMQSLNDSSQMEKRRRLAEAEMRKAGIKPEGMDYATVLGHGIEVYTDAQIDAWFDKQEKAAAAQKKTAESSKKTEGILASTSGIINAYLVNTYDAQRKLADDRYASVQKALKDKMAEYKKAGVDITDLLKQQELARGVHEQELAALRKRFDRKDPGVLAKKKADKEAKAEAKAYKQQTRDLDLVADAMRELEEKSGQYGLSIEYTNQLIERQGELWLKAGVPEEYVDQLKSLRELEASREGWAGAMLATQEYYSEATNMAEAYKSVVTNAFGGMEDAIVTACQTGKLSFSDMVNSMIADLMRLMVRQSITGPLASALGQGIGSLFAVPNGYNFTARLNGYSSANPMVDMYADMPAGVGHDGWGLVGSSRPSNGYRSVPSSLFANAPRFHSGTGYIRPGEYPAILKAGERVLNPAETRAYQSRREPNVNVNIINSTGQQASTRTRTDNHGNKTIDVYVGDMAAKQMATPGTSLNRAVSAQTGTRRPAIRR